MHGWEPNTWSGQNVEAEPITVIHPTAWEVPEQEPSTLQSETIHLQQELARVRSDLFRSEQKLEALRGITAPAERQENVADRLVPKVDYEGEGPRELIPIVLGFERLGELLSHLHPHELQEAAKAKELSTLRPWPQGQGDLSHCEDPEGLVTKYVEQSLVWAAMIVSRCRSMFVLAHLKQKRMGAQLGKLAKLEKSSKDSFGFVPLLTAIVSGWRNVVKRRQHRQLAASNMSRATTATISSLLLVALCRWSRLACQSRQWARASKWQEQLSSQLAALRRSRYLHAGWCGFAVLRGNRKARRVKAFMDPEAVAARRALLHSTPSDVWLLQVLQVFRLEVESSRSRKREIAFQMQGKKLTQLVAGAMLPKWEAASRCALLGRAFAVLRQAALQGQRPMWVGARPSWAVDGGGGREGNDVGLLTDNKRALERIDP
ncbi:unnamed protein product [Symbiodinium sp. KB8]|nr:unnamed protein product [Symbiodinium sp. KB8]